MILDSNKTALLIFTRTAASEVQHKTLLRKGASQNQKLVLTQELINRTRQLGAQSGLDVVVCTDFNQHGETFGKRLSNAISETFAKGYSEVIAIGTDTPALSLSHINRAVISLQNQNIALGPSTDGGVYLIGIHRKAFNPNSFESLPWLTSNVYEALLQQSLNKGNEVVSLETLSDIDDVKGLYTAIGELKCTDQFYKLSLQFLVEPIVPFPTSSQIPSFYDGLPIGLRAPPTA